MSQHKRILPEAAILLGDYDLDRPLESCLEELVGLTKIWWIAGNHDFESPGKYNNINVYGVANSAVADLLGNTLSEN